MGIDIALCRQEEDEFVLDGEWERVASVDAFFVMAYWFSNVLQDLRKHVAAEPSIASKLEALDEFIGEDKEEAAEMFDQYYEFVKESIRKFKEEHGIEDDALMGGGAVLEELSLGHFSTDAKSFLALFMLSETLTGPAMAKSLIPLMELIDNVFGDIAEGYAEKSSGIAENLKTAQECLGVVTKYLKQAVEQEKLVVFSA